MRAHKLKDASKLIARIVDKIYPWVKPHDRKISSNFCPFFQNCWARFFPITVKELSYSLIVSILGRTWCAGSLEERQKIATYP